MLFLLELGTAIAQADEGSFVGGYTDHLRGSYCVLFSQRGVFKTLPLANPFTQMFNHRKNLRRGSLGAIVTHR